MSIKKLLFLIIIILIITSGLTAIFYSFYIIRDVRRITMDLKVEDSSVIGMNVDNDGLHFGTVPRGGSSTRRMIINHKEHYPLFVSIHTYGNFLDWLAISDNNFIVEPNTDKEIKFTVSVPGNALSQVYNGTVIIVMKRAYSNI